LKDALKKNSDSLCKTMHDAMPRAKFSSVRQKKNLALRDIRGTKKGYVGAKKL